MIAAGEDNYLKGLERSFDEAENKIVDLYVTLPKDKLNELIKNVQISINQVQNGGAKNLPDFQYLNTTIVAKLNGYELNF